jgi:Ca2+-binding RTX toxin-like protein
MATITGDLNPNLIFGDQTDALAPTPEDFIDSQDSNDLLEGKEGNDTIFGLGGDDRIFGNQDNDLLHGDSGEDEIYAGQGSDTVIGGSGNDSIQGNKETDLLFGLDGDDTIEGNLGDDFIFGGEGNDSLTGNRNSDRIFGGENDDILDGGTVTEGEENIDVLTGGNGNDVFGLRPANTTLTITDYVDGTDKFTIIADPLDPVVLANTSAAVTAADITAQVVGTDTQLTFINEDGDRQIIAVLQGFTDAAAIDATDFI